MAAAKVRATLLRDGVAPDSLQTSGLSLYPSYGNNGQLTGFQASESLTAELRDLKTAGKAISDAVRAGGDTTRVDGVTLDLTDQQRTLLAQARAAAIADARSRATEYAKAAGLVLGPVRSITEPSAPLSLPQAPMEAAASAGSVAVPISAGTLPVSQSVVVVYQAK